MIASQMCAEREDHSPLKPSPAVLRVSLLKGTGRA
jgi:hypothetical protein